MTGKFLSFLSLTILVIFDTGVLSKDSEKEDDERKEESSDGKYLDNSLSVVLFCLWSQIFKRNW